MILYLLCHRCTIFLNDQFCMRAHRGWDRGGRSCEVSRELLSDPMGRCEVSSVPASTHPLLTSICRGTCRTTGFVWGVGVMTERSHTHSAPHPIPPEMENNRYFCYEVKRFLLVGPFKKKRCFYSGQHSGVRRVYAFTPTWTFGKNNSQWNNKCQSCENI